MVGQHASAILIACGSSAVKMYAHKRAFLKKNSATQWDRLSNPEINR